MADEVQPPTIHVDADGWTVRTYRDGNWTRQKIDGDALVLQCSWGRLHETPKAVQEQDAAAAREAGRQWAMRAEKAFLDAFMGVDASAPDDLAPETVLPTVVMLPPCVDLATAQAVLRASQDADTPTAVRRPDA